jgi:uridine kinase
MNAPVILGIAGCSGSGKTTLAEELAREVEGRTLISTTTIAILPASARRSAVEKFAPSGLESDLLIAHISLLRWACDPSSVLFGSN